MRFATYHPNAAYPSQEEARVATQAFLKGAQVRPGGFRLFRRAKPEGRGLYLDGGFGVGKTHLLASAWHEAPGRAALMSFQDLMYIIGALGMTRAVDAFRGHDLLLIDEFELDDPGNTHMANTFLGQLMPGGTSVIATSNTEPGALGQGASTPATSSGRSRRSPAASRRTASTDRTTGSAACAPRTS